MLDSHHQYFSSINGLQTCECGAEFDGERKRRSEAAQLYHRHFIAQQDVLYEVEYRLLLCIPTYQLC